MTGHLAALAAVAQGATPRVVPRPRSRFEAGGGQPARGTADALTDEAVDAEAPTPRQVAVAHQPAARATGVRRAVPDVPSAATITPPPDLRPALRRTRPEPEPPAATRSDVVAAPSFTPPRGDRPAEPDDAGNRTGVEQGTAVTGPPQVNAPPAPDAPAVTVPDRGSRALPLPQPVESPVGALVAPPLPPSAPAPVAIAPTNQPRTSAAAVTSPDVHVTIGRLEIRTGPGQAEPAERTAPVRTAGLRSLEEYGAARASGAGGAR